MEVAKVFSINDNYRDPRFEQKKPVKRGNRQQHPTNNDTELYFTRVYIALSLRQI
jgi:hypothetical protein